MNLRDIAGVTVIAIFGKDILRDIEIRTIMPTPSRASRAGLDDVLACGNARNTYYAHPYTRALGARMDLSDLHLPSSTRRRNCSPQDFQCDRIRIDRLAAVRGHPPRLPHGGKRRAVRHLL